jgi:hypothetical protein
MASLDLLTVPIVVRRRSLAQRIIRFPFVAWSHYTILRRTCGRRASAYGAWLLASLIITVGKEHDHRSR